MKTKSGCREHEREESFAETRPQKHFWETVAAGDKSAAASPTVTAPACRIHFSLRQKALFSDPVEI